MKSLLKVPTFFYTLLQRGHQFAYQRGMLPIHKVKAYVISVGNLTCGGSGKTPLAVMLARNLASMRRRVGVLTRGFGGDEQHELKDRLSQIPILVGSNRVKSAERAIKDFGVDTLILDDGFQHRRLARQMDIVVLDASRPWWKDDLLPLGRLREPIQNLRRATLIVLSKTNFVERQIPDIKNRIRELNPSAPLFIGRHRPIQLIDFSTNRTLSHEELKSKPIGVLSGIEDPLFFEKMLTHLGFQIIFAGRFPDHHPYSVEDLKVFADSCRENKIETVITTQKDYYRLSHALKKGAMVLPVKLAVLQIEFEIENEPDFLRRCLSAGA